jgi:imidazolonepropionase-like amidohydrolase
MKLFAVAFMLLSSVGAFAGSAANHGPSRIWITDVTIISPENLDRIEEGNVLIERGRIISVERRKGTKKPAGATAISGKGQFLIPGLIDSHVHLASIPGVTLDTSFGSDAAKSAMINE